MTWIKICGTTNLEDANVAFEAGADALGFVFHEKSRRYVNPQTVRTIVRALPGTIEKVGVFVNQDEHSICATADAASLTAVQLHGDDMDPHVPDLIVEQRPHLKVMIAISMNDPKPERRAMMWRPDVVHAFLVDAATSSKYGGTRYGGTGRTFDWQASQPSLEVIARLGKIVVAGGLNPGNVSEAIRVLKPWGVDVVTGVEAAPGKKDPEKVRAFVDTVRQTEVRQTENRQTEKKN